MLTTNAWQEEGGDDEKLPKLSLDKYKAAANVLNESLHVVVDACQVGARVVDICEMGDQTITKKIKDVFVSCKEKGIAFPTCLSINSNICHASPLPTDDTELREKDIIKIEMSCQVDGYVASHIHTLVVSKCSVTGRVADVIGAVNTAGKIISDVVEEGRLLEDVTRILEEVAGCFRCKVLNLSGCQLLKQHEVKKASLMGSNLGTTFLRDRAYLVDIAFASEKGEVELLDEDKTTVYRSVVDAEHELSDETLRPLFNEIMQKFKNNPFSTRSLENFSRKNLLVCTNHGILEPYHILHMKSGFVAYSRFILLVKAMKTLNLTRPLQQDVSPMIPVENMAAIDKLWGKMSRRKKGKQQCEMKLAYCGRLPVGEESCGNKPHISDICWSMATVPWGKASQALACTGSFGTCVYLRPMSFEEPNDNIELGWKKITIQDIPGSYCKWSPNGKLLAVGVIREADHVAEVYIVQWDDNVDSNITSRRVYVGDAYFCSNLNSMAWSCDNMFLVAPSDQTHHIPVLKVEKNRAYIHLVRFSDNKQSPDDLCVAFHPQLCLFVAASTNGRLKLYDRDLAKRDAKYKNKADIWNENHREWVDDCGTREISFCALSGDRLACARSDGRVKIWSFKYDPMGHGTFLLPLYTVEGLGNLSISCPLSCTSRTEHYIAIADGRQVITIYNVSDNVKLCSNEHSVDLSAYSEEATRLDWHSKLLVLASGGRDGFILFWSLQSKPHFTLAPNERNIHVENMYYTHKSLPCGAASAALAEYERTHISMISKFKDVIEESQLKDDQLKQISILANSGLSKIYKGDASIEELADYLKEIIVYSTKVVKS